MPFDEFYNCVVCGDHFEARLSSSRENWLREIIKHLERHKELLHIEEKDRRYKLRFDGDFTKENMPVANVFFRDHTGIKLGEPQMFAFKTPLCLGQIEFTVERDK